MLTEEEAIELRVALLKWEGCSEDLADLLRVLYLDLDVDERAEVEDTFQRYELDL